MVIFYAMQAAALLGESRIIAKMAKQFQHADKRNIPYAVIVGEQEIESNVYSLKNLTTEN
jgi:histidyl-tRNA synthetase